MLGPGALLTSVLVANGCRNEPPADPLDSPDGTSGVELPQADSEDAPSDDGKTRLDAGGPVPGAPPGIDCGDSSRGNDAETFQHIWIANSSQGTVSKIDTESGEELGRYLTGPGNDDPSRTSVGLDGDVVVANRAGGIVKIYAETADCADEQGQRQTSSGPQEILEWGTDTCVAWHVALPGAGGDPPNHQGPRPVAWDVGPDPCLLGDERVWVGWYDQSSDTGHFRRLDGASGETLDTVEVPGWSGQPKDWGPYGGAVDAYSNFWIVGWGGPLVRIDANTLEVTRWDPPSESFPYGIALDAGGHPWLSGLRGKLVHFDPERETFETMVENLPGEADIGGATVRIFRGLQIDRRNRAWLAANAPCGLVQVDLADGTVFDDIALTDCVEPVGVAIDPEGFIWTPDRGAGVAYRVDPMDLQLRITPGLVDPYTYSDMTGAGLHLVVSGYEP